MKSRTQVKTLYWARDDITCAILTEKNLESREDSRILAKFGLFKTIRNLTQYSEKNLLCAKFALACTKAAMVIFMKNSYQQVRKNMSLKIETNRKIGNFWNNRIINIVNQEKNSFLFKKNWFPKLEFR